MNIYPAIDIKSGECVRLYQGCYADVTVYTPDPLAQAKLLAQQGATTLHVVDLDGAKQGRPINSDLIIKISQQTGLNVQAGGGVSTRQQIRKMLNMGISRVILGSIAISQPELVKEWLWEFGSERIVLALDIRLDKDNDPKLALHGWQIASEKNLWELLTEYQDSLLQHVLCTDINSDGTLQGSNISLYKECVKRYPSIQFQASGGISSLQDLRTLATIPVASAIVGKALYENVFSLSAALAEVAIC